MRAELVGGEVYPSTNRWILLTVVMLGTFTSVLDTISINVSLPYIMITFGSNIEQVKWATIGFMIAAAVTMPLTHSLGQRLGYDTLYLTSLLVFTAGAAFSASSWNLESLITGRILQGLGAGIVQPASIAILTRAFPPYMRGRAFGVWSAGVMMAPILAPTMAGLLIEFFSWRAIFMVSLLVGSLAVILAKVFLVLQQEDRPKPFDWWGYLTLSLFLLFGLVTISFGQDKGWDSIPILTGGAVALGAFVLFIVLEWDSRNPLVPLRLFRTPDFTLAMLLTLYKSLARVGAGFLLPIFLQRVQGRESLQIGFLLTLGAVVNTFMNPISGWLTDRYGSRWLAVLGTMLIIYFLHWYSSIDALSDVWFILWPQAFRGLGISLIDTPVMTTGVNAVSRQDTGHASWMLNLSQRVGGALSVTVISTLLFRQTAIEMDRVGGNSIPLNFQKQGLVDRGMLAGLSSRQAVSEAQSLLVGKMKTAASILAYQRIYFLVTVAMATSLLPAFLLTRPGRRRGGGAA